MNAIKNGKSLLPAGVKDVHGFFEKGDHVIIKNQNDRSRGSIYCRDKQWQMENQNVALKNEIEICNNKLESVGKKLKYFEELIVDKQNELKGKENVNPSNKNGLDLKFKNCKNV